MDEAASPLDPPASVPVKKPKAAKKYIKSTVTVHDRTQIETVFDYYLYRSSSETKGDEAPQETLRYKVDAYLFYPRQFGLDASTYPKERFFSDIRPLLRFREPKLGYKAMLGLKPGAKSPLIFLREYIAGLNQGQTIEPMQNALDEVRLFACAFVSTFLRGIDRNRRRLAKARPRVGATETTADVPKIFGRMIRLMDKANDVLEKYRELIAAAENLPMETGGVLLAELRLIDEYCYYRLRDGFAYLTLMAEDFLGGANPLPEAQAFERRLKELLTLHDEHAARCGYIQVQAESSESLKEQFVHRRGQLKRRIWGVLFLEMRTTPLFSFQRQFGAMIAAGVAAMWYAVAQILFFVQAGAPQKLRDVWGLSGLLFLIAGTFAYVVKDRIKEFGRTHFGHGIFRRVPDHSESIYYANRHGDPVTVGSIKETAKFLKASALPERVAAVRAAFNHGQICEDEAIDQVLQYTKDISLSVKLRILNRYPLRAVHDILRLNIDACLPRLGEPTRFLNVVNGEGDVEAVQFPKVYYLDLALSYSKQNRFGKSEEQALDYFRLVIDKNGLLRIERLS